MNEMKEFNERKGTERIWDCGSPLYDSSELVAISHQIERNLVIWPYYNRTREVQTDDQLCHDSSTSAELVPEEANSNNVGKSFVEGKRKEKQKKLKTGLYQYRLGDVVKIKGFHNSTPELQFIFQGNLLLTINIDKNTQKDLQYSLEAAAKLLAEEKQEVVDFTSRVDISTEPGHYVIFWEVSCELNDSILEKCCNRLDTSFVDAGYVNSRKVNAIGPLELGIVKKGTFHKILDHYVGLGAAVTQFKTLQCVGNTNSTMLQILSSNVVKSYFSTAF